MVTDSKKLELAPIQLEASVTTELNLVVRLLENLREGPRYWRESLYSAAELQDLRSELTEYKNFLTSLQALNSPGKLRNFSTGQGEVRQVMRTRKVVSEIKGLYELIQAVQPQLDYIYQAEVNLPNDDAWQKTAIQTRTEQLKLLSTPAERTKPTTVSHLKGGLSNLQDAYTKRYIEMHTLARLDSSLDAQKKRVVADPKWVQLRALSGLDFLQGNDLRKLESQLGEIRSCPNLSAKDLQFTTVCPACGYLPRSQGVEKSAGSKLQELTEGLDGLHKQWINALVASLKSESSQKNLKLLGAKEREQVNEFLQKKQLPEKITDRFISALKDTLQGLEIVDFEGSDFLLALTRPGMPCTPDELGTRYQKFLAEHMQGKDPAKVRIRIDW